MVCYMTYSEIIDLYYPPLDAFFLNHLVNYHLHQIEYVHIWPLDPKKKNYRVTGALHKYLSCTYIDRIDKCVSVACAQ